MSTKETLPEVQLSPLNNTLTNLKNTLDNYESKVLPKLLHSHGISPSLFAQVVLSEIKKNDKLLQAFVENPSSMFASILSGAEIGLIPSDTSGEFYLIPRSLKQSDGKYKMTVTPLIGYKGLVNLLLRSGDITKVHAEVVYEGDVFEPTYGLEDRKSTRLNSSHVSESRMPSSA